VRLAIGPPLVLALSIAPARAQVALRLSPALTLAAGYDDNLFLDANPAGVPLSLVHADAVFDVAPALAGEMALRGHRLSLSGDFLERVTLSNGELRDGRARLAFASAPLAGRLELDAAGLLEVYQATAYPDNTFILGGGQG
jgi:hypothetical protein